MRLKILGGDEIDALYAHPRFTHEERVEHFALSPAEVAALEQLHSIKSKIFFILQLGYFKARHMFFVFDLREVEDDVGYIRERYFPDTDQVDPTIAKGTRLKQQRLILELCNYRAWNTEEQKKLAARSRQAATVSGKPIYIFRELTHYLLENRIVAPGYSLMQDTVGGALAYEQRRLASTSSHHAIKIYLMSAHLPLWFHKENTGDKYRARPRQRGLARRMAAHQSVRTL